MGDLYNHEQDLAKDLKRKRITVNEISLIKLATVIKLVNEKQGDLPGNERLDYNVKALLSCAKMTSEELWSCGVKDELIANLLYFRDIHYNNTPRLLRAF
jgi:hypothetical protein